LTLFSQKTTLIDGDTSICFTVPRAKFLLKQIYLVSEKDTLLKITENQLKICTQEKIIYEQQLSEYEKYINNQKEINSNVTAVSTQKDEQIKALNKNFKTQKLKTWGSIFVGVVSTAFVSYLWISK
jgi:hypothetical protein